LDIICFIATRNIIRIRVNDFPEAIYKFGRTPIAHEGELDDRTRFDNKTGMSIGEIWNFPPSFIIGMILSLITAPENALERLNYDMFLKIHDETFNVFELWGQREKIRDWIESKCGYIVFER